jgi:RNA polymerase sigma-70 factor (ECF subfamily)
VSASDGELVARAVGGDRGAMNELLGRHHDRIYAVCRRITGNDADAADATQEALISVVRHLARFDGRSGFGTWVYRIATNASLDELRRRRRRPLLGGTDSVGDVPARSATTGARDLGAMADHRAEEQISGVAERMVVDAALASLPEDFRTVLVLRDLTTLDYAEIAELLDLPIGTVKSRIARGRLALAAVLGSGSADDGNRTAPDERPTSTP